MKAQLRTRLAASEFQQITDASLKHGRTVSILITLTYDADALIRWRAIDAIGRCAARLCKIKPEAVRNTLRRLFWMMNDESGSVARHAPEAIGEIIRSDPLIFADFIPMTIALLDLEAEDRPPFLPGILYALGRIGEAAPDAVSKSLPGMVEALSDIDSQARAMAVLSLGLIGAHNILLQHPELSEDSREALIYRGGELTKTTVSRLWTEALA